MSAVLRLLLMMAVVCWPWTCLQAQTADSHPWRAKPVKADPVAYFTNLESGEEVQSPFVVKFGLTLWGLAPAGQDIPKTGHYYLIIDRPLPLPGEIAPLDRHHVEFSKGQMEAVLNLDPGPHTLRLLLVDHQRIPRFIFSRELRITVRPGVSMLPGTYGRVPQIDLLGVRDGQILRAPFKFNFHASALNVSHSASAMPNTGYFRLRMKPLTGNATRDVFMSFPHGATEVTLDPPAATYEVQLFYVKNPGNMVSAVATETRRVIVQH